MTITIVNSFVKIITLPTLYLSPKITAKPLHLYYHMIASEKQRIQRLLCFSCSAKESAGIKRNAFSYLCKYKISKQIIENKRSIRAKRKDTNILPYQKLSSIY